MQLAQGNLAGQAYLAAATDLLHRIRLEDAHAGRCEAADVQWWWREDDAADATRQTFWYNAAGDAVACWLRFDDGERWRHDLLWLPSAQHLVETQVFPVVIAGLSPADKPVSISVSAGEALLRQALEAAGFRLGTDTLIQAELAHDPAPTHLSAGFQLTSRIEDDRAHHLMRRNGAQIEAKLAECSLYRPDLDLCVRTAAGEVAAYALFWMDDVTKVGLLEPLRTERHFQRLGLARHLIAAGVTRLRALGATSIRVAYSPHNEPAARLYHQMGFVDKVTELDYRRDPPPAHP